MAASSLRKPTGQTALSYSSVKTALENVRNLEEVCKIFDLPTGTTLESVAKELLDMDLLSWRGLMWRLDWANETDASEAISGLAEPLADSTHTVDNITTVLNEAENWRSVMKLRISPARQAIIDKQHHTEKERKFASIEYYVNIVPLVSWELLACALYECGENRALNVAKIHLPYKKELSLTTENVMEELKEVVQEVDWRKLGNWLYISKSKCESIAATHHTHGDCLRALVDHWIHTHPCPSWRRLAWVLEYMEINTLAEHIRDKFGGASELSLEHYRVAMEKSVMHTTNHNIVLLGIAGGGKTHTMCLLLGKDPPKERTSTICAERPVRTVHGKQEEGRWVKVSPKVQMRMVANTAKAFPGNTRQKCPQQPGPNMQISASQPTTSPTQSVPHLPSALLQSLPSKGRHQFFGMDSYQKNIILKMEEVFAAAAVQEVHFINLMDSGGQQQFHEVLPDFLPSMDAIVLVHNASQPLQHYPQVEMFVKDKLVGTCHSPLNNLQIIQRCLQTVQPELVRGRCPVIVFIGTHGDLEYEWPESRDVKNAKLMELLTPEMEQRVIFCGERMNEPLCVINAKTPGADDEKLVNDLRKEIHIRSRAKSHAVPLKWHGMDQAIRGVTKCLGRDVLSKEECLEVALTLHFTPESLEEALRYLAELKQLHYYSFLPNVIFADSQVLLDKISELVRFHYHLREAPSSNILAGGTLKKFRDQGIISLDILREERFSANYVPELFGPEELLLVLEKLLIIAKVSGEDYLMPCLLPHMEDERIAQSPSSSVSPLLIHFPGGPRLGVFCHLLAYLLKEAKWELVYKDRKPMLVNRNSVAFAPPDLPCQVTLSDPFLSYFHISVSSDFPEELPSACPLIRAKILAGIGQVCANLNYSDCVPMDAFFCPAECSCLNFYPHLATVMPGNSRKYLSCTINKGTQSKITDKELVWFVTSTNTGSSHDSMLDLPSVTEYLLDLDKAQVYHLAISLGLSRTRAKNLRDSSHETISFLDDVITAWLQRVDQVDERGGPTWRTLVDALRSRRLGHNGIADKIEREQVI